MIEAVLFDFGETLVERVVDDVVPLTELPITPFADAAPALERLTRAGCRLAVVSNTSLTSGVQMRTVLQAAGLERFLDAVVTSFDARSEKPHPAIFLRALELLACPPRHAAMVGNDLVADVGGAAAVGMTTVLVARDGAPAAATGTATPTFTVSSLLDVPGLLGVVAPPA
ncbi:MAG TPA: HAD family hydrolase [Acidimicrobiales bacterium]|nr:HAD family hydrolase [Acidimicrobiales bacterium]